MSSESAGKIEQPDRPARLAGPAKRWFGVQVMLVLFATGAAGLTYEVAWQRHLAVIVGVDHAATAVTLAVFLGGLSLGYALCGELSMRTARPLAIYAWLELAIAVWGMSFPWTFAAVERVSRSWSFEPPYGLVFGSLGAAVPLVLVPAMLMGATMPLMTRGLALSRTGLSATHARVYGWNTLGAVAGALAATFVLVPAWGPNATVRLAATLNLGAAALLFLFVRARRVAPVLKAEADAVVATCEVVARTDRGLLGPMALASLALLSGAATMAHENALIRLLGLVLGGTPFVFGLTVAAFVAAIATGSFIVARRRELSVHALWAACIASSVAWLLLFPTYDEWPWLAHILRLEVVKEGGGFTAFHALAGLALSAVVLLAAAPLGAIPPLVFAAHNPTISGAGRASGRLFAWNALGCLLGSLAGGLLLYYVTDLPRVLLVAPLIAGVMAFIAAPRSEARAVSAILVAACLATAVFIPGYEPNRLVLCTYRMRSETKVSHLGPSAFHAARMLNRNIIHREDGPLDSVAVMEVPAWDLPAPRPLEIYINGKSDSNTRLDRETLRLSAHLPLLLARDIRRVLVIGQGTGVTAGELTLWPELHTLDLVEVSPSVARTLPLFGAHTRAVHTDPRLRVHIGDARFYARAAGEPWDVIVSEPSNLWVGGSDLLFTVEFFRALEARLAPGGILLQWMHLYEVDAPSFCQVIATLHTVFPSVEAYRGTQGDWLLIARRERAPGHEDRSQARWDAHPEVQGSLAEFEIKSLDDVWKRRVRSFPPYAERALRSCPVHTALDARIAYRASRALFDGTMLYEHELLGTRGIGLTEQGVRKSSEFR